MAIKRGSYRTGRERVERILDASHELFISTGYRATSLRDIAAASGISHPSLLRHFSSKAEILTALVDRLDRARYGWPAVDPARLDQLPTAAEAARRNEATPGWIPLFTALLGEATSPEHPGHELMRRRLAVGTRVAVRALGLLGGDPRSTALAVRRLGAAWDGLQVLSLYFPGRIDIPARLAEYEHDLRTNGIPPAPSPSAPLHAPDVPSDPSPRARAVEAAARLYARRGYYGTSMQAVADQAGLTKAALVHVAPTKQALLDLVVTELTAPAPNDDDPAERLLALRSRPRWQDAAEVVLMCEATVPSHPAHPRMAARLDRNITATAHELAANGQLTPDAATTTAQWLVALALGAVIAHLYDPDDVDLEAVITGARPPRPLTP
ncbi:TetR/AcrR family transcriptional regulator [Kitasatospora sp. NPDC092948]|uniref:TetR/AcrR family transcriptional regulator n=1 Tax=Kitasatospora sp. NPDC092948 TaxID=3364088 RepID=UPI003823F84A